MKKIFAVLLVSTFSLYSMKKERTLHRQKSVPSGMHYSNNAKLPGVVKKSPPRSKNGLLRQHSMPNSSMRSFLPPLEELDESAELLRLLLAEQKRTTEAIERNNKLLEQLLYIQAMKEKSKIWQTMSQSDHDRWQQSIKHITKNLSETSEK